jgi:hypothetical protein
MDDETPEMEVVSQQMRAAMAAWVADPGNEALKRQFRQLQARYQRLFLEFKRRQQLDGAVV